ncbi:MAG TPA: trypsin-like peptidase domain-containing protein [Gaiellaceae bacterium]|nr:trypsin-like peptidase domain-containing protein [Gaiellaceae bacterium]
MRVSLAVAIALGAAVLGGVAALALGSVTGLTADDGDRTVYVSVPAAGAPTGATTAVRPAPTGRGAAFDAAAVYASRVSGVVTIYSTFSGAGATSQGSGFVVDEQGSILTNAHVVTNVGEETPVRGADQVYVEFDDGERVPARIVGWDLFADVGVIAVDPDLHDLAPLPLGDSETAVPGAPVAAIGSPFGNQSSLAVGVVSATGRSIPSLTSVYSVADAIQVDAPINRGNSGGPLLDADGRVIGVNAQIRSSSGMAEGVGFAIPINIARRSLQQLLATGRVAYAYIGIKTQDVTPGIADRFDLGAERGALVDSVEPGTPAARAGLRGGTREEAFNGLSVTLGGDLIVRIGDREVESADDVSRIVTEELLPGQRVPFVVLRGGKKRETVEVTLVERPPGAG